MCYIYFTCTTNCRGEKTLCKSYYILKRMKITRNMHWKNKKKRKKTLVKIRTKKKIASTYSVRLWLCLAIADAHVALTKSRLIDWGTFFRIHICTKGIINVAHYKKQNKWINQWNFDVSIFCRFKSNVRFFPRRLCALWDCCFTIHRVPRSSRRKNI